MPKFEFEYPARYDEAIADDGVWTTVIDENDAVWGRFKLALFDITTQRYKTTLTRLQRKYRNRKGEPASKDHMTVEIFVEMSLVDWEVTIKGKAVPFSKEAAIAYLNDDRALFALKALSEFANDVRNFQPEGQDELPEGN